MATPEGSSSSRSPLLWWGISAIFVAGVIIALVIVLAFGRGTPQADPPPSTATTTDAQPPPTEPPSPGASSGSGCQLSAGSQQIPQQGPQADWTLNQQGVVVPTSPTYGPAVTDATGVTSCFSRDPMGALMAAAHLFAVLGQQQDKQIRLDTLEQRLLDGPQKDELMASAREFEPNPATPVTQIAGYRFVQYTNTDAYITLAATVQGRDGIAKVTYHLLWKDGDWYFSGDDTGTASGGQSSELSEFTSWGPR